MGRNKQKRGETERNWKKKEETRKETRAKTAQTMA